MINHSKENGLHLITMDEGSSTICPDWQLRMLEILGEVEDDCDRGASLVLAGAGKFFCNGLNLEKVMTLTPDEMKGFGQRMGMFISGYWYCRAQLLRPSMVMLLLRAHFWRCPAITALCARIVGGFRFPRLTWACLFQPL